jgi:hypothetical protein
VRLLESLKFSVGVLDTSNKDLLNIGHLINVELHEALIYDILNRVLYNVAYGH